MELSFRMEQVMAMAEPCRTVADIGCDHGYVAMELVRREIAERAIAMDVRQGPLSRAKENVRKEQLEDRIECRLSDGLEALQAGEADAVVIAGMGGPLMVRLLTAGREQLTSVETLVLQPQSEISEVRRYLHKNGWRIAREAMLLEDGKYYTVLQAKPGEEVYATPEEYRYGAYLLRRKHPVLQEYLYKEAELYNGILNRLKLEHTSKTQERMQEVERILQWNQEAQRRYEVI